jgi:hypothetical protein
MWAMMPMLRVFSNATVLAIADFSEKKEAVGRLLSNAPNRNYQR